MARYIKRDDHFPSSETITQVSATAAPDERAVAEFGLHNQSAYHRIRHLGDFTTNPRVLVIASIAVVVGTGGVIAGAILLDMIRLATNLAYFGRFTLADLKLGASPLGLFTVVVPVAGR